MKTSKNILIAFLLNLLFAMFEFWGGVFTGSVAIFSDAVHDLGDAVSIGISYLLEKKSQRQPDENYTYGYSRYSVIGGVITTLILLLGSLAVIANAINRLLNPQNINYKGMIIFAIAGVFVNFIAAYFTRGGESLNQKAVNLHMLEDVLGWCVVLTGAVIMNFTDLKIIDPLMSVTVAIFIIINTVRHLKEVLDLFLEKTPKGISVTEIKNQLCEIEGILNVHHIHIRSMDGFNIYATMHIVTNGDQRETKEKIRLKLSEYGIVHATLELENTDEICNDKCCSVEYHENITHHHHHH